MTVDISFEFAKVYNIDKKIDVQIGQKFSLITDFAGILNWFNDNDPVLEINKSATGIDVVATDKGSSTILIMDNAFKILKELTVSVVQSIAEPATDLGLMAEAAEPK